MTRQQLFELIRKKESFLCIGLDSDINKIPQHLLDNEDPVYEFNKQIIDATHPFTVAYKPNLAFYESRGTKGWISLEKTIKYLHSFGDNVFTIADAKRGDIGNTSEQYARTFFESMDFDAVTVAPYMGIDSVSPFLKFPEKWVILLALTSNEGSFDFQMLPVKENEIETPLYQTVIKKALQWATTDSMMFVVGATRAEELAKIRKIIPDHFLLIPGVGAQGGSLTEVARYGINKSCGLLVNSSRNIIFASNQEDFSEKAREEAQKLQQQMKQLLLQYEVI
ncbi:MAG: orotidine-5'-phosphate decarboxylase [Bacteroidales bacterium]